jgi:uncharacterized OB-fold protein
LKDDLSICETTIPSSPSDDEPVVVDTSVVAEKLNIMFCTKCGKENRADSAFCGYCGNPFTAFIAGGSAAGELTKGDMDLAYYRANLQMQQQALQIQQRELEEAQRQTEQQQQQIKLQKRQYDSMLKCPRCGSTYPCPGTKKDMGRKGLVGAAVAGPFGLVAGNLGSKKVIVTCMNCVISLRLEENFRRIWMKYCVKCGNAMEDDMSFCQKCGAKAESDRHQSPPMAPELKAEPIAPQPFKARKGMRVVTLSALFLPSLLP